MLGASRRRRACYRHLRHGCHGGHGGARPDEESPGGENMNPAASAKARYRKIAGLSQMTARELGIICALLAAMPNPGGLESSGSQDYQFEKQVKRAEECRQLQDKLVGDQPLTPERAEEIAKTMDRSGCTARLLAH